MSNEHAPMGGTDRWSPIVAWCRFGRLHFVLHARPLVLISFSKPTAQIRGSQHYRSYQPPWLASERAAGAEAPTFFAFQEAETRPHFRRSKKLPALRATARRELRAHDGGRWCRLSNSAALRGWRRRPRIARLEELVTRENMEKPASPGRQFETVELLYP